MKHFIFPILLLLIVYVISQTFLEDKAIKGLKMKITRNCVKDFNDGECSGLNPPATACIWFPKATTGQCVYIDSNGILQNMFDS